MSAEIHLDTWAHVFAECDTVSLLSLASTNQCFRTTVAHEFRLRMLLLLGGFFAHRIHSFTGLLRLHNAIVSGSAALAFFLWPVVWESNDLDVYIGDAAYADFVCDFERIFSVVLHADFTSRSQYAGIRGVRRYVTRAGKYIDVIRSESANAAAPMLHFWSSVVMNFITWRGAVCGFPQLTFSREALVADHGLTEKAKAARSKYEARGIKFREVTTWRPSPGPAWVGPRTFSIDALLVLDFRSVWAIDPLPLPISRAGSAWVIESLYNMGISGSEQVGSHNPNTDRSASLDRSQCSAFRGATDAAFEGPRFPDMGGSVSGGV